MIPQNIWDDQEQFTHEVRQRAEPLGWDQTHQGTVARTKELMLHLISECNEVLDACGTWKAHVPKNDVVNRRQLLHELIDIQKYWIMLCQLWGYTPEELTDAYWKKSAAVRQKYAETWVAQLTGPIVIVDLDNVLADFTTGFGEWLIRRQSGMVDSRKVREALDQHLWLDAGSLGIHPEHWPVIKHQFRTEGGFATLPIISGAQKFVRWVRDHGAQIVALTSRPIDRYPNIYVDTVEWLRTNHLDIDYIWWGVSKAERIKLASETYPDLTSKIWFAVDDDAQFVRQFSDLGIRTYWLTPFMQHFTSGLAHVTRVRTLADIQRQEKERS